MKTILMLFAATMMLIAASSLMMPAYGAEVSNVVGEPQDPDSGCFNNFHFFWWLDPYVFTKLVLVVRVI